MLERKCEGGQSIKAEIKEQATVSKPLVRCMWKEDTLAERGSRPGKQKQKDGRPRRWSHAEVTGGLANRTEGISVRALEETLC